MNSSTSLAVRQLRLHASNVGGMGWIPGQGTKIPNATIHGQKKKKTQGCKFKQVRHTLHFLRYNRKENIRAHFMNKENYCFAEPLFQLHRDVFT